MFRPVCFLPRFCLAGFFLVCFCGQAGQCKEHWSIRTNPSWRLFSQSDKKNTCSRHSCALCGARVHTWCPPPKSFRVRGAVSHCATDAHCDRPLCTSTLVFSKAYRNRPLLGAPAGRLSTAVQLPYRLAVVRSGTSQGVLLGWPWHRQVTRASRTNACSLSRQRTGSSCSNNLCPIASPAPSVQSRHFRVRGKRGSFFILVRTGWEACTADGVPTRCGPHCRPRGEGAGL